MADDQKPPSSPPDPAALARSLFEDPLRAQASFAASTFRQLSAPVLDAFRWQRELADSLAASAEQLTALARGLEELARQHAAVTDALHTALEPYLRYVDWLEKMGAEPDQP